METCTYCGNRNLAVNNDGLYVCRECATVLPRYVLPRRKPYGVAKKEMTLVLLYGYA